MAEQEQNIGRNADSYESIPDVFRRISLQKPDEIAYSQAVASSPEEEDAQALEVNQTIDLDSGGPISREHMRSEIAPYLRDSSEDQSLLDTSSSIPADQSAPWRSVQYAELEQDVEKIAAGLASVGVERGVRAAILSNTRPEWMEAELGVLTAGGTVVTCYTSDPTERIGYVLWDSGSKVVFIENQEQADKISELMQRPFAVPETENAPASIVRLDLDKVIHFEDVTVDDSLKEKFVSLSEFKSGLESGVVTPQHFESLKDEQHLPQPDDEASVVYTSGTTGAPKGVIATHRQHLSNVRQILRSGMVDTVKKSFQLLPLAHGFGLQLLHTIVAEGGQAVFPRIVDPKSSALTQDVRKALKTDMKDGKPDIIALVPKVLQGMKDGILAEASKPGIKGKILSAVVDTYTKKYVAEETGEALPLFSRIKHALFESKLCGSLGPRVKEQLKEAIVGEDFQYFISGGALLPLDLHDFFWGLDMPVYDGWGSTEINVPATVNRPGMHKRGSIGAPLDEDNIVEIEDGELIVSGPNVAKGYNNRPQATAEAWDERHRYHTKDRGEIDDEGFVFIRGRVDDLIVLLNGKNIEPEPIEDLLRAHPRVKDGMVVGHGKDSLTALVIEEPVAAGSGSLSSSREANALAQEILDAVNSQIEKKTERLTNIAFIPEPTVGDGYTPTMKLQKKKMLIKHANLIEELYAEGTKPGVVGHGESERRKA